MILCTRRSSLYHWTTDCFQHMIIQVYIQTYNFSTFDNGTLLNNEVNLWWNFSGIFMFFIVIKLQYNLTSYIYDRHKSASTDIIISNQSNLRLFSNQHPFQFSDLWPFYWLGLGHSSVTSLDVDLRIWKKDTDLRYRCLRRRNWT